MTFLPVVERELRAAARRKGTFRARWWAAAIAIVVTLFSIAVLNIATVRAQGGSLFSGLTGFAFGLTLLAGVVLTADALSEEKRMGTLGLLFLTDLKGYDVVLGKLAATSLNAAYGLLALVPVIALALLLGGVTGTEFVRVALALLNSLFVSLAAGLAVSAFIRDTQRAMGNTIGLLLLLIFASHFLDVLTGWRIGGRSELPVFSALSPLYAFQSATRSFVGFRAFAMHLLLSNLVGWFFIVLASWRLPRFASEEGGERKARPAILASQDQAVGTRSARRQALLSINPVLWLLSGEPATVFLTWLLVGVWWLVMLVFGWLSPLQTTLLSFHGAKVCSFLLEILIAVHACRFFAQARANGALEMLATTPLTNREVLKGQWLHLKRLFFWPVIIFWVGNFVPFGLATVGGFAGRGAGNAPGMVPYWAVIGFAGWFSLTFFADVVTVGLVGIRLALTMRKPALAPGATILLVLILPSFLCGFGILADIGLSLWAYNGLKLDFRYSSPGLTARF